MPFIKWFLYFNPIILIKNGTHFGELLSQFIDEDIEV